MLTFSAISRTSPGYVWRYDEAASIVASPEASTYLKWLDLDESSETSWRWGFAPGCPMDKYRGWKTTQWNIGILINHYKPF